MCPFFAPRFQWLNISSRFASFVEGTETLTPVFQKRLLRFRKLPSKLNLKKQLNSNSPHIKRYRSLKRRAVLKKLSSCVKPVQVLPEHFVQRSKRSFSSYLVNMRQ